MNADPIMRRLEKIGRLRDIALNIEASGLDSGFFAPGDAELVREVADNMDRDTACRGCNYGGPHDHRCRYGLDKKSLP